MSKIIKSHKLGNYTCYEPKPYIKDAEAFSSLHILEENKEVEALSPVDYEAELREQLRLGYETGFKRGYEDGFALGKKEGFEEGLKEGKREAEKKFEEERFFWQRKYEEEKRKEFTKIQNFLIKAEEELKKIILDMDIEIVKIVTKIMEKLLLKEISQDKEVLLRLIKEALNYIAEGTEITIRANPQDLEFLESYREIFPQTNKVNLLSDNTISPGGLFIETKLGVIDATFEKRWERMLSLLKDRESA